MSKSMSKTQWHFFTDAGECGLTGRILAYYRGGTGFGPQQCRSGGTDKENINTS